MSPTDTPPVTDGVTTLPPCEVCGGPIPDGRADRRTCGDPCRQQAYRDRKRLAGLERASTRRSPKAASVYQCPECEQRLLGQQRCPDCNVFCHRLGPGAACPHCDEPVTLADLTGSP